MGVTAKYCLFGYYGQGNAGDEAILASIVSGLTEHEISLTVYSAQPHLTSRLHQVESCVVFSRKWLRLAKSILRADRISTLRAVWRFIKADVVVIGGGGLFFDTPETNKWLYEYVSLIKLAKRLGKKVAIVGVSVGPLHHKDSEDGVRSAFEQSDLITVRDLMSQELLVSCGVSKTKIHVVPDLVFALPPCESERAVSILKEETGFGPENLVVVTPCAYNLDVVGWLDSYRALVNELTLALNYSVVLVPMQCVGGKDDLYAAKQIVAGIETAARPRVGVISDNHSPMEIQGVISLAKFVFSERLHGTIMAANTGRPFMSLVYMPKVAGVLNMLGKSEFGVSMSAFCDQKYLEPLIRAIKNAENDSKESNQINAIQKEARLNLDYLIQLKAS